MRLFLVVFLLFILPFFILPFGATHFETPKVILAEIGIILLCFSSLIKDIFPSWKKIPFFLFGIVALTLFHIIFFRTSISFFGNIFRLQGIFLLWLLLIFSIFSAPISLKKIPWWMYFIVLAVEFWAVFHFGKNASGRSIGTLGEPNALAAFVIFIWPFFFFSLKENMTKTKTFFLFFGICMSLIIMYFSGSRSGYIAFGIQIIFLCLQQMKISLSKSIIFSIVLIFSSYFLLIAEKNIPYENRLEIWQAAFYGGFSYPVFGGGFGNTELILHAQAKTHHYRIQHYYVDSSHNIFLDWWVQGGIVGVILLTSMIVFSFSSFIRSLQIREITLLVGMLVMLSFNPASVVGLLSFWWILGQGLFNFNKFNFKN